MIAATGSAVAFSGSFVDMLMSAVLGTFLGFVMLFVVGKGKTATNIFEIGTAGFLAFVAVSIIGFSVTRSCLTLLLLEGSRSQRFLLLQFRRVGASNLMACIGNLLIAGNLHRPR